MPSYENLAYKEREPVQKPGGEINVRNDKNEGIKVETELDSSKGKKANHKPKEVSQYLDDCGPHEVELKENYEKEALEVVRLKSKLKRMKMKLALIALEALNSMIKNLGIATRENRNIARENDA
ncbi:hypothetical protein F8M41_025588 [Gigaspora margarita]|uniref:Uncharacterized protein n=1 Tax=Gigaspora margarita TaxID=4874 RepID=A0A8H4AB47_GIGMA|nr:hypothetical protein F8M41_025588 [Gigaspora margarita]